MYAMGVDGILVGEFIEIAEAVGDHNHDEKEKAVVGDVHQCGSCHGVEADAHGGKCE
jgi:hypothetical protein